MSSKWRRRRRRQNPTITTTPTTTTECQLTLPLFQSVELTQRQQSIHRFNVLFGPLHCIKAKNALILLCLFCSFSLHKRAKIIMQLHRGEWMKLVTVYNVHSADCGLLTRCSVLFSSSISISNGITHITNCYALHRHLSVKGTIKLFKCYEHQVCNEIEKRILMERFAPQIQCATKFLTRRFFFLSVECCAL